MTHDDEAWTGECPTCHQPYLRGEIAKLTEERDALAKQVDLAREFLGCFDLYYSLLRPSSQASDAKQAMMTAAMDFRAALAAGKGVEP